MKKDSKIEFTVVQLTNQFKIIGIMTKSPDISTFTIDLQPDVPRRYIDGDMPSLVYALKDRFYKFIKNSHKFTTPFENHTDQTVFYFMTQLNIRILDTVSYITHAHLHVSQQLDKPFLIQPMDPMPFPI